ncbi:NAD(P)/FAD-dependent oxidoreductase [Demequina zhanjiangensis]|uniref:FAD-binding oxidoreductase n=1 Tax=Demequina zhanjiangensis TaxID=3051659 RepID=A0ABT8FXM9_9MICO|nr:FAD-binding oxidoreductase [Demequina sp. SYSU T00b26]MDN4471444.1 FAD-binding oxidoreductase [Demequina sp. SYSU T00b26]
MRPLPQSLWWDTLASEPTSPEPLKGDTEADVAIVGAGFTGLWTAHYLAQARPDLRIVVLEKDLAGFGASGRNGGWASALLPSSLSTLAKDAGRDAALAQHAAMRASVDEVIRASIAAGIDAGLAKGGTVVLARSEAQEASARAEVEEARRWGRGPDELVWLDADDARARLAATDVRGATYTPDCAAIHPGRLVRGLADVARQQGVALHEDTRVTEIAPHRVVTERGTVTADLVVRATEGYTPSLAGMRRDIVPVHSLVVATEPLPPSLWDEIGLASRETFSDHRHLLIYGQRTADGRLVFGGRGAPYHLGSQVAPEHRSHAKVHASLRAELVSMLPQVADVRFTHAWGGALGVARDWHASVGLDKETGIAWAGGYVGDGVTTTNLAGRTLRDLLLGHDTDLTALPWVGHRSRRWEVEPLRWLGVNAGLRAMSAADAEERITGRPSVVAKAMSPLLGGH